MALTAAVGLSLLLMATGERTPVRQVREFARGAVGWADAAIQAGPTLLEARRRNRELQLLIGKQSFDSLRTREIMEENRRLRRLLGLKTQSDFRFIPAEVTGSGAAGIPGAVFLNVGWEDGCRKDMVLMTDRGVVGKIISVSQNTSVGHLMADPNFRISAKDQRSRVLGIVRWLYGNVCVMEGVSNRSDIRVGDRIVTSGYSQIYPPGLPVGRVFDVRPDSVGLFQQIRIRTEVDFDTLEEVLVIVKQESTS